MQILSNMDAGSFGTVDDAKGAAFLWRNIPTPDYRYRMVSSVMSEQSTVPQSGHALLTQVRSMCS